MQLLQFLFLPFHHTLCKDTFVHLLTAPCFNFSPEFEHLKYFNFTSGERLLEESNQYVDYSSKKNKKKNPNSAMLVLNSPLANSQSTIYQYTWVKLSFWLEADRHHYSKKLIMKIPVLQIQIMLNLSNTLTFVLIWHKTCNVLVLFNTFFFKLEFVRMMTD